MVPRTPFIPLSQEIQFNVFHFFLIPPCFKIYFAVERSGSSFFVRRRVFKIEWFPPVSSRGSQIVWVFLAYPMVSSFFLIASGLKCNSCLSSISFKDCFNQRQTAGDHCDEDYNCGKSHYKYKGRDVYSLSCVSITHCNNSSNMCNANLQMSDCHVTCSGEDLCNTTSIPVTSVFFVLACLVGTFMMSLKWDGDSRLLP